MKDLQAQKEKLLEEKQIAEEETKKAQDMYFDSLNNAQGLEIEFRDYKKSFEIEKSQLQRQINEKNNANRMAEENHSKEVAALHTELEALK